MSDFSAHREQQRKMHKVGMYGRKKMGGGALLISYI
jgi:hypothetical protein